MRVFYVPALAIGAFACFVLWLGMYLVLCLPLYLLTRLERRLMPEEIGFEQIGSGGWNLVTPLLPATLAVGSITTL